MAAAIRATYSIFGLCAPDKYLDMVAVPARYVRKQIPYGILGPLAVQVAGYVRDTDIECA